MAIDSVTGKKHLKNKTLRDKKIEEEKRKKEKALPKFDITYEEELIKALFNEDLKSQDEKLETLALAENLPEKSKIHKARPGED